MRYDDVFTNISSDGPIKDSSLSYVLDAIAQVYPVLLIANLTKNSYVMVRDTGYLHSQAPVTGNYDELIAGGVDNLHANYKERYLEIFSREGLMARYENGVRINSMNAYMMDRDGNYQWVTMKAARIMDESGDIIQLCMDQVRPD